MFDLTSQASFLELREWLRNFEDYFELSNFSFMLIGNKLDLIPECGREVSEDDALRLAESLGESCSYFETSALTGEGIK